MINHRIIRSGCGIVGAFNSAVSRETMLAMTNTLSHRGPDGQGLWSNPAGTVHLGHRRLAIVGLDNHSAQPMTRDRTTIVCNGEIYNYPALHGTLEKTGYHFKSNCDTEVILHAYNQWGLDCLKMLNGVYAFCLYDDRQQRMILARDPMGVKPLVYYRTKDGLIFASEVKALLASGLVSRRPNFDLVRADLTHGLLGPKHETWFEGIYNLDPGRALIIECDTGKQSVQTFWDYPQGNASLFDESETIHSLRDLFNDAVRLQLQSDVGVSTTCSGGIDSAALSAIAWRETGRQLDSFTVSYEDDLDEHSSGRQDLMHARVLADAHPGLRLHVIPVSMRKLISRDTIDTLVRAFDGPVPFDIRVLSFMELYSQVSQRGHKVLLNGQGADELWMGYYADPIYTFWQFQAEQLSAEYLANHFFLPRLPLGADAWNPNFLTSGLFLQTCRKNLELNYQCFHGDDPLNRLSYFVMRTHLQAILNMDDKIAMTAGVETRVPWLDPRIVELSFRVPGYLKLNSPDNTHKTKWLLRQAMRGIVPASIIERKKSPFPDPPRHYAQQLRHLINEDAGQIRQSRFLQEIFSTGFMQNIAVNHQLNERNLFTIYILWRFSEIYGF